MARLDQLFSLLQNGSTAMVRKAAARQIAGIVKSTPTILKGTLNKIKEIILSNSWDARTAAAFAIECIANNVQQPNLSVGGKLFDNSDEEWQDQKTLLKSLSLPNVIGNCSILTSSDDEKNIHTDNLTYNFGSHKLSLLEYFETTCLPFLDKIDSSYQEEYPFEQEPQPTMNLSGNEQSQLDIKEVLITEQGADSSKIVMESVVEATANEEPIRLELQKLALWLEKQVMSKQWTARHGAAVALKALMKANGGWIGMDVGGGKERVQGGFADEEDEDEEEEEEEENESGEEKEKKAGAEGQDNLTSSFDKPAKRLPFESESLSSSSSQSNSKPPSITSPAPPSQRLQISRHVRFLDEVVAVLQCAIALDRFGDYGADQVVAPVREACAQALGTILPHLTPSSVVVLTKHIVGMLAPEKRKGWEDGKGEGVGCGGSVSSIGNVGIANNETILGMKNGQKQGKITHIPQIPQNPMNSLNPLGATSSVPLSTEGQSWDVKHGMLLCAKYICAVLPSLDPLTLPLCLDALVDRVTDDDDDVRAVAADALVPVVERHASIDPNLHPTIVRLFVTLWRNLLVLDDLSVSSSNVMLLLAALCSHAGLQFSEEAEVVGGSDGEKFKQNQLMQNSSSSSSSSSSFSSFVSEFPEMLPRLFPFFRHPLHSVRLASVKSLLHLLFPSNSSSSPERASSPVEISEKNQNSSSSSSSSSSPTTKTTKKTTNTALLRQLVCRPSLVSELMAHLFQSVLLETQSRDTIEVTMELWGHLCHSLPTSVLESVGGERLSQWLTLLSTQNNAWLARECIVRARYATAEGEGEEEREREGGGGGGRRNGSSNNSMGMPSSSSSSSSSPSSSSSSSSSLMRKVEGDDSGFQMRIDGSHCLGVLLSLWSEQKFGMLLNYLTQLVKSRSHTQSLVAALTIVELERAVCRREMEKLNEGKGGLPSSSSSSKVFVTLPPSLLTHISSTLTSPPPPSFPELSQWTHKINNDTHDFVVHLHNLVRMMERRQQEYGSYLQEVKERWEAIISIDRAKANASSSSSSNTPLSQSQSSSSSSSSSHLLSSLPSDASGFLPSHYVSLDAPVVSSFIPSILPQFTREDAEYLVLFYLPLWRSVHPTLFHSSFHSSSSSSSSSSSFLSASQSSPVSSMNTSSSSSSSSSSPSSSSPTTHTIVKTAETMSIGDAALFDNLEVSAEIVKATLSSFARIRLGLVTSLHTALAMVLGESRVSPEKITPSLLAFKGSLTSEARLPLQRAAAGTLAVVLQTALGRIPCPVGKYVGSVCSLVKIPPQILGLEKGRDEEEEDDAEGNNSSTTASLSNQKKNSSSTKLRHASDVNDVNAMEDLIYEASLDSEQFGAESATAAVLEEITRNTVGKSLTPAMLRVGERSFSVSTTSLLASSFTLLRGEGLVQTRGVSLFLKAMAGLFGERLFVDVPQLWDECRKLKLKMNMNVNGEEGKEGGKGNNGMMNSSSSISSSLFNEQEIKPNTSSFISDQPNGKPSVLGALDDSLVLPSPSVERVCISLRLIEILAPTLTGASLVQMLSLFPSLLCLCVSCVRPVRILAAHSAIALTRASPAVCFAHCIRAVPKALRSEREADRAGAIYLAYLLTTELATEMIPWIAFFLIPILGGMSDILLGIRQTASRAFASLLMLVTLSEAAPLPPGVPLSLHRTRQKQQALVSQLTAGASGCPQCYVPVRFNGILRHYQQEGINWLAFLNKFQLHGILADDMGLGKTLQTLCVIVASPTITAQTEKFISSAAEEERDEMKKEEEGGRLEAELLMRELNEEEKKVSLNSDSHTTPSSPSPSPSPSSTPSTSSGPQSSPQQPQFCTKPLEKVSLIICPTSVVQHWIEEAQTFFAPPSLSSSSQPPHCEGASTEANAKAVNPFRPVAYLGTAAQRQHILSQLRQTQTPNPFNLVVASYDVVRRDVEQLSRLPFTFDYCVLDEGHFIRNVKSKATMAVKQIKADHRLILTGTPIQNRPLELWSLFDFLMPGFLGTHEQFNRKFGRPIQAASQAKASEKEQEEGAVALDKLHKQVLPFVLRRLKENVLRDLPPKIIQDYYCEMSGVQREIYLEFERNNVFDSLVVTSEKTEKQNRQLMRIAGKVKELAAGGKEKGKGKGKENKEKEEKENEEEGGKGLNGEYDEMELETDEVPESVESVLPSASLPPSSSSPFAAPSKQSERLFVPSASMNPLQAIIFLRRLTNHPRLILSSNEQMLASMRKRYSAAEIFGIRASGKLQALRELLIECGIGKVGDGEGEQTQSQKEKEKEKGGEEEYDEDGFPVAKREGNGSSSSSAKRGKKEDASSMQIADPTAESAFSSGDESCVQHRALIFAQTKEILDLIETELFAKCFPSLSYLRIDGSVDSRVRFEIVRKFRSDPTVDVLMLTRVGSVGLNLACADIVIFVENDWNPANDMQAMDRAHRIGQTRVVNVYRLITRGTVEEKILGLQRFKQQMANAIVSSENADAGAKAGAQGRVLDLFGGATGKEYGEPEKKKGGKPKMADIIKELDEQDTSSRREEFGLDKL